MSKLARKTWMKFNLLFVSKNLNPLNSDNDLICALYQIAQRVEGTEQKIPFEFEEMLSQLTIIREEFEKKVIKTSARIDSVR